MKKDNVFMVFNTKGKEVVYEYRWGENHNPKFRLERATRRIGTLETPPTPEIKSYEELDRVFLLVSERGSGFKFLRQWLTSRQEHVISQHKISGKEGSPPKNWVLIDGNQVIQQNSLVQPDQWNAFLKQDMGCYILDRTFYGDNPITEKTGSVLTQINATVEAMRTDPSFRFIHASYHLPSLEIDPLFSNLLDQCHVYRLPQFNIDELCTWLDELVKKYQNRTFTIDLKDAKRSLAQVILYSVGGQPRLTSMLFRLVDDAIQAQLPEDERDTPPPKKPPSSGSFVLQAEDLATLFRLQGTELARNPPHIVERWKEDLTGFLKNDTHMVQLLRRYADNQPKPSTDAHYTADYKLYLAGWVGFDPEKKWGIRSQCHKQWAGELLRHFDQEKERTR
ncbi:hypothetical protein [Acanthopleuribacter pedis]|uniref:Uncharacterized protein n=1 Tax=Acanthopleuribacter pedis TaxID=442870 RepID=A0A8J7Q561_9BACT|nr:hypothetical protein [Acanthopleuribacter pedis]MBO1319260.1 hypothetical protein [Acanthopleuribacter pedis]